jgi:hypothetical protein
MTNWNEIAASLLCIAVATATPGCDDGGGKATDAGTDAGAPDADCTEQGDCPLISDVGFVWIGTPEAALPVITDLAVFRDRLYLTTSINPLGSFGAIVYHTVDGESFTPVIDDPTSQGFLRLRVIDDFLYVPDGDPNSYDPSYVYISDDGDQFSKTTVIGSVHTFDVINYAGDLLCSNGMMSGSGSLCRTPDNGESPWTEVEATSVSRLKFMTEFNGSLYVAKRMVGTPADYVVWSGNVDDNNGTPIDAVDGEASTWRWYVTGKGRLFWSLVTDNLKVFFTDDGEIWTEVEEVAGEFVSDFAELDGNLYLLSHAGLWGSTDETEFTLIAQAPDTDTFGPIEVEGGFNVEGAASMTEYNGHLWCGSTSDGSLYRVE